MSERHGNTSTNQNHQRAAELHDAAAHAHRVATETHGKQDHQTGHERSRQALEHSQKAFEQTGQLHRTTEADVGHEGIALRAHELWQARGCPEGSPEQDWFRAARELKNRRGDWNR